jgi:predicted CoA-binding protein
MRPVRTIIAVIFAAAVAVTGCGTHTTADQPSAPAPQATGAAAPPTTAAASHQPAPKRPTPAPQPPTPRPVPPRDDPAPVLADGRYDSYIRTVDTNHQRLVVDLVQVFKYPAAVDAAIADGLPRDQAQVLYVWVRNQNPRLRTLALASDLQLDLLPDDCIASRNHQLAKLIKDSRAMSNSRPAYYFTLTVAGGAIHHIQEDKTFTAC